VNGIFKHFDMKAKLLSEIDSSAEADVNGGDKNEEKPYACYICGQDFAEINEFNRHYKGHKRSQFRQFSAQQHSKMD